MDDKEIIALYMQREQSAIQETSQKYNTYCTSISMNILKSLPDAEECVNDTYLHTWNSIPPQNPKSLKLFLATIVRRLSIDRYRSWHTNKRNRDMETSFEELADCIPAREDNKEALLSAINNFLATIDKLDRILFIRKYWYAQNATQMSKEFGISAGAIRTRLCRTRELLRSYLEERGFVVC